MDGKKRERGICVRTVSLKYNMAYKPYTYKPNTDKPMNFKLTFDVVMDRRTVSRRRRMVVIVLPCLLSVDGRVVGSTLAAVRVASFW